MSSRSSRTLYVGNLPGDVREREIEDLFHKYGPILDIDLKIPPRPPGYAFVEFEDPRDAEDAIRGRDGYDFAGNRLRVELAHGGRGHSSSSDRHRSYNGGGARGGVSRRSNYRVRVTGLPSSASWQDLKDHMRRAGDVCFSEVFRDGGGTTGIVDYSNYDDMKYAIKKLDDSEFRNAFSRAYIRVKEYESKRSSSRSRSRSYSRSRSRSRGRSSSQSRGRSKSPKSKPTRHSVSRSRSRSVSSHSHSGSKGRHLSGSRSRSRSPITSVKSMDAHLMIPATLQLVAWNAPWIVNLVPADYVYENFYSSVCELCWNLDSKHLCSVLVTTSLRIQTVSPRHSLRIATCARIYRFCCKNLSNIWQGSIISLCFAWYCQQHVVTVQFIFSLCSDVHSHVYME